MESAKSEIREFVVNNLLFGQGNGLADDASFVEQGIVDPTGAFEFVAHLQQRSGSRSRTMQLMPDNPHSIDAAAAFVECRHARASPAPMQPGAESLGESW